MPTTPAKDAPQPIYLINFEAYLRPKRPHKIMPLQCFDRPERPQTRCEQFHKILQRLKFLRYWRTQRARFSKRLEQLPLPRFLNFLRARHDDGLCKSKTGFEIYCEMSSIHGFHVFVGACTWQRVLWWLLICTAILLSLLVLIMSYSLSAETPTIRYIESMLQPISEQSMSYPALSICSMNRISKSQLRMKEYTLPPQSLPWLTKRNWSRNEHVGISGNISWSQLLENLAPRTCESQVLGCLWQGLVQSCDRLLTPSWSYSEGRCCTFNGTPIQTAGNPAKGLTLRLASQLEDYASSRHSAAGFQLLLHEAQSGIHAATERALLPRGTEAHVMLRSYNTHATPYIDGLKPAKRGCYLSQERLLFYYPKYSQANCLAECESERILKVCSCVHPHMPKLPQWPLCQLEQLKCLSEVAFSWDQLQRFCNCLPSCQFKRYEMQIDLAALNESYPMFQANHLLYGSKNFNGSDEVLLHVYFDSFNEERVRLDVYENFLTFIGTFGGITGLFMGCSFVSVFELIFFVCVRPTCNWLTRQQIRYRRRRQQRANGTKAN
ncbi:PREDICTED: pickpocket protein 11 [Drosophila arizonae]|uniref:Pickpocket protein 11 n=1 Tax=Drosophila arizonae TaxID=7263 RepID=A0ABM1NPK6_DROAR|nr:PREDICTED: pickpocket protein 11 [Drosophila arizonae]